MKTSKGFSLIEVLLSLVILSIVFMIISNFFLQSALVSERNNEHYMAISLARSTIEKVKNGGYPEISGPGDYIYENCNESIDLNCTPVINEYTFSTRIVVEAKQGDDVLYPFTVYIVGNKMSTSLKGYISLGDDTE